MNSDLDWELRRQAFDEIVRAHQGLNLLSQQCRATGRASLSDSIYVTPCGGTKLVGHLASLFLGQDVRPVVLLDGDAAGIARRDALAKELYAGHADKVVMLDAVLSRPHAEIEDILGEDALVAAVNTALGLSLNPTSADRTAASAVACIEAAAKRLSVTLPDGWKPTTALNLVRRWAEAGEQFSDEILDRAATLRYSNAFQRITTGRADPPEDVRDVTNGYTYAQNDCNRH